MPRTALRRVGQRLTELGCPPAEIRRRVRELAEHHEDLVRDAREEGLSETEAEARADARLGEPQALAERLAASFRHCSWWGRHPILGFCVVPPLAIIPSFVMALWVEYLILHLWLTSDQIGALGERE